MITQDSGDDRKGNDRKGNESKDEKAPQVKIKVRRLDRIETPSINGWSK
jgi:hypothetical protein